MNNVISSDCSYSAYILHHIVILLTLVGQAKAARNKLLQACCRHLDIRLVVGTTCYKSIGLINLVTR